MIRISVILLIALFSFFDEDVEKVYWSSDRKVTEADFRGKPPTSYSEGAAISSGLFYKPKYNSTMDSIIVECMAYFVPEESWIGGNGKLSKEGVKHEQGHFDIAEIFARKFRKEISTHKSINAKFFNSYMVKRFRYYYSEFDKYQDLYDDETHHKLDVNEQKRWDLKIQEELKALEAYSGTEIRIKIE